MSDTVGGFRNMVQDAPKVCYVHGCKDPLMYETDYPNGFIGIPYRRVGTTIQYRHAYHGLALSSTERLTTEYNLTMWQAILAVSKGIKTGLPGSEMQHWILAQIELEDLWSSVKLRTDARHKP